jgi:hypothetical protein
MSADAQRAELLDRLEREQLEAIAAQQKAGIGLDVLCEAVLRVFLHASITHSGGHPWGTIGALRAAADAIEAQCRAEGPTH